MKSVRLSSVATALFVSALAVTVMSCGGGSDGIGPSAPSALPTVTLNSVAGSGSGVLVGAGDIARCETEGARATAKLLDEIRGTVFLAGDNAYPSGSAADYRDCFDPTWGRHRSRIRPVPGNHEYQTPGASAYFDYFGGSAGTPGLGYYSYTVGPWLVLAINSELPTGSGSAQQQWVADELTRNPRPCTAAIWHRPLFSSGVNGANLDMQDLWRLLHRLGVDIVINGHEHLYERFAPQGPDGRLDLAGGMRQFTVGTGGVESTMPVRSAPNSEVTASAWGVTKFTLQSGSYHWEFVPVEGGAFRDTGTGTCH